LKLITQVAVFAAMLSPTASALAQDKTDIMFSVQGLYQFCNAAPSSKEALMCITYVSGVMDIMQTAGLVDKGQRRDATQQFLGICPQSFASYGAGVQLFKNWAEKHPENWSMARAAGVAIALKEVWPCA